MKTIPSLPALIFLTLSTASGADPAEPSAANIASAMNDGIELRHGDWQKITELKIEKGGKTGRGDWVYICSAKLAWSVSSKRLLEEFTAAAKVELANQPDLMGLKELAVSFAPIAISAALGEFESGDPIGDLRFRVSLIHAGDDWIVLDSKFSPGFSNPMDRLSEKPEK